MGGGSRRLARKLSGAGFGLNNLGAVGFWLWLAALVGLTACAVEESTPVLPAEGRPTLVYIFTVGCPP
ncbi:MAG TPA: hypothetical protein PKE64_02800 [Anaerolineae bacterium]|nr:hypothetical protein [Anaerolineae bacterium]